eukprot:1074745-Amorphochlora_amoeboformis.AAC.2
MLKGIDENPWKVVLFSPPRLCLPELPLPSIAWFLAITLATLGHDALNSERCSALLVASRQVLELASAGRIRALPEYR